MNAKYKGPQDGNTCLAGLYQNGHDPRHPRILLDRLLQEFILTPEPSCLKICVNCINSLPRSPKPRPSPRPLPRPRPVKRTLRTILNNGRNFILMGSDERFVYFNLTFSWGVNSSTNSWSSHGSFLHHSLANIFPENKSMRKSPGWMSQ